MQALLMSLLYGVSFTPQPQPLIYFPPRAVIEGCLNGQLSDWYQEKGINQAFATMFSSTRSSQEETKRTAFNLVATQEGMTENPIECETRSAELYKAIDQCRVDRCMYRSLKRRFRRVN
jgi:hypothetical protein